MVQMWLKRHLTRTRCKLIAAGIGMTMLNALVLALLVAAGVSPVVANWSRTLVTTQIRFGLHRRITRRERHSGPFWQEWRHFLTLKMGMVALQLIGFWVLLSLVVINYLVAYLICAAIIGTLNMILSAKLVFWDRAKKDS